MIISVSLDCKIKADIKYLSAWALIEVLNWI